MKTRIVAAALMLPLLAGCSAAQYRPIVDTKDVVDLAQYHRDLDECQRYAAQIDAPATAGAGAVLGGVVAALVGAAFGLRGSALSQTAAAGAVVGGSHGAAGAAGGQINIVRNCMAGRGYKVLL